MMKGGVEVDQVKIGNFLKKLRKEKGITQEQLAEILNVFKCLWKDRIQMGNRKQYAGYQYSCGYCRLL